MKREILLFGVLGFIGLAGLLYQPEASLAAAKAPKVKKEALRLDASSCQLDFSTFEMMTDIGDPRSTDQCQTSIRQLLKNRVLLCKNKASKKEFKARRVVNKSSTCSCIQTQFDSFVQDTAVRCGFAAAG